jgi:hypothetical protein
MPINANRKTTLARKNFIGQKNRFYVIHSRGTCSEEGKQSYTHSEARQVARNKRRREKTNHHEYRCVCTFWHIGTSLEGNK